MPLLITKELIDATKEPAAGWSRGRLVKFTEEIDKDKKGNAITNRLFIYELLDGPNEENENKDRKMREQIHGAGIHMEIRRAVELLLKHAAAFEKIPYNQFLEEAKDKEIDFNNYIGEIIYLKIEDVPGPDGNLYKNVTDVAQQDAIPF